MTKSCTSCTSCAICGRYCPDYSAEKVLDSLGGSRRHGCGCGSCLIDWSKLAKDQRRRCCKLSDDSHKKRCRKHGVCKGEVSSVVVEAQNEEAQVAAE